MPFLCSIGKPNGCLSDLAYATTNATKSVYVDNMQILKSIKSIRNCFTERRNGSAVDLQKLTLKSIVIKHQSLHEVITEELPNPPITETITFVNRMGCS